MSLKNVHMNTSNKILVIFTIFLLLIPVMVILALKSKVKKGDFVVRHFNEQNLDRRKTENLDGIKAIHFLNNSDPGLRVIFVKADSAYLEFDPEVKERFRLVRKGDTAVLFVENAEQKGNNYETWVRVSLPAMNWLELRNANARLTTWKNDVSSELNVRLDSSSSLQFGPEVHDENPDIDELQISKLDVNVQDAKLNIGKVKVGQLQIRTSGKSELRVDADSKIESVSGSLSDSTLLHGGWHLIKALASEN
jgi:hypothetical protein